MTPRIEAGQKWTRISDGSTVRVLCIVENYVVRFPRAVPFCVYVTDFLCEYKLDNRRREVTT
jgi:hypothetical protein